MAAGTVLAVTVPHALAAADKDHLSPAGPTTGTSTNFKASGTIGGIPFTTSCSSSTLKATVPAAGLGPVTVVPTFTGCMDNFGGVDTVKVKGKWKLTFVDAANDEAAEKPGDQLKLTIPKGGATFTSSFVAGCTITVAPTAAFSFSSAYDDVSTATVNVGLPVAGSAGCPAVSSPAATTATYTLSPGVHDVS